MWTIYTAGSHMQDTAQHCFTPANIGLVHLLFIGVTMRLVMSSVCTSKDGKSDKEEQIAVSTYIHHFILGQHEQITLHINAIF